MERHSYCVYMVASKSRVLYIGIDEQSGTAGFRA